MTEEQYLRTVKAAIRFARSLAYLNQQLDTPIIAIQRAAVRSQLQDLVLEIAQWR